MRTELTCSKKCWNILAALYLAVYTDSMNIQLRDARKDDAQAMCEISCQSHLSDVYRTLIPSNEYERFYAVYTPHEEKQVAFVHKTNDMIDDKSYKLWVAESEGVVVGYTIAKDGGDIWLLKSLFVTPNYQGRGIGRRLFRESYKAAPEGMSIELTVIQANARAVRMYEQEGFHYRGPAEATFYGAKQIVMRRKN